MPPIIPYSSPEEISIGGETMINQESYVDQWCVLQECRLRALHDWRNTYAGHKVLDDLFAEDIRSLTLASKELPGGYVQVKVTIRGRKPWQDERRFFKGQQVGGVWYLSS
jgi:hypothetical protein